MNRLLDCLIIGGGPAGLTAGIYLGRFRRNVLIVDKGWSRAKWITKSHNLPGFPGGLSGAELLKNLRDQAAHFGVHVDEGVVDALTQDAKGNFQAHLGERIILARTVMLATGVVEVNPPIPHVADAVKRGLIRTCPICDGFESIGKRVAVLGHGEHAASEALFLRTYTDQVSLLLLVNDNSPLPANTLDALRSAGITINHVAEGSVLLDQDVEALSVEDGQIHGFDVVYSAFGTTSQTELLSPLGVRMDCNHRLLVDEHQATSLPGLFAAGDVVRGLNQISVAEGEAAIAATAVHNFLPKTLA